MFSECKSDIIFISYCISNRNRLFQGYIIEFVCKRQNLTKIPVKPNCVAVTAAERSLRYKMVVVVSQIVTFSSFFKTTYVNGYISKAWTKLTITLKLFQFHIYKFTLFCKKCVLKF